MLCNVIENCYNIDTEPACYAFSNLAELYWQFS